MSSEAQGFALQMEAYIIPSKYWDLHRANLSEKGQQILAEAEADRYPTAIALHPEYGYFILSSGGQGPCIDWSACSPERLAELIKAAREVQTGCEPRTRSEEAP